MPSQHQFRRQHAPRAHQRATSTSKTRLLKRSMIWLGAFSTAVVTGVSISLLTSGGLHFLAKHNLGGPPVNVDSVIRQESDLNGASIAFPQPLSLTAEHLKELDKESTFEAFMRKHGGADVGLKLTQIVLTGNRKEPVRILDIRAINQCGPVLTGTLFASPPAGGDDTIRLGFDLDRENPRAKLMVGDKVKSKGSYFNTKTISLRSKEQQPFQILAWTSDSYCEFRLELTVLAGREIETQLIRDGTEPFKVTALTKRARDTLSRTPFADYQKVYIGRILHGRQEVGFIEVDPSTWE